MTPEERKANYNCDITYVTNNELGFDYLRDNGFEYRGDRSKTFFLLVDEIDSILIDEAPYTLNYFWTNAIANTKIFTDC